MTNDKKANANFMNDNYLGEFPYEIGTTIEMIANPNILAEIRQYRVTSKNIFVGLGFNIYESDPTFEVEITMEELKTYWKKTNRIILKGNIGTRISLGEEFNNYAKTLKLFK